MTRKPNRSVAVAGAPPPAPEEPEAEGVEVMESVVELGLGEIDGDDMVGPRTKMPPVEKSAPGMNGVESGGKDRIPAMNPTFANPIPNQERRNI